MLILSAAEVAKPFQCRSHPGDEAPMLHILAG
jgi:hypothetical protein